jgi:hypothetical protein
LTLILLIGLGWSFIHVPLCVGIIAFSAGWRNLEEKIIFPESPEESTEETAERMVAAFKSAAEHGMFLDMPPFLLIRFFLSFVAGLSEEALETSLWFVSVGLGTVFICIGCIGSFHHARHDVKIR